MAYTSFYSTGTGRGRDFPDSQEAGTWSRTMRCIYCQDWEWVEEGIHCTTWLYGVNRAMYCITVWTGLCMTLRCEQGYVWHYGVNRAMYDITVWTGLCMTLRCEQDYVWHYGVNRAMYGITVWTGLCMTLRCEQGYVWHYGVNRAVYDISLNNSATSRCFLRTV